MGLDLPQKLRIGMAFSAAIATAVIVGACGSGIPGNAVAVVGSAPISKADLAHWEDVANDSTQASAGTAAPPIPVPPDFTACIAAAKKVPGASAEPASQLKDACQQQYTSLVDQAMNFLIQSLWIEGEAVDKHVSVTKAQVLKSYATQRKTSKPSLATQTALNDFLAKSGQTNADLLWRTKLSLLANGIQLKVQKDAEKVSKAKLAAYYKKNHAQFVIPETLSLHLIETSTQATATTVLGLLKGGSSFATLAPKYSIDPTTKTTGGKMTGVRPGQLTPAQLNAAVFKAKTGQLVGPLKTPFGYWVFTVDSSTPGKVQTLKEATTQIRATIAAEQVSAANAGLQADFTTKWTKLTKCATGFIVAPSCGNAPTATGSTGATGAT